MGGPKNDGIITLFDQNLGAFEAISFWETNGLAATVLENLGGNIYSLYLRSPSVKL